MPSADRTSPFSVPIWLDCDPGNDDAFAILLAAFHPSFHLLGISTVHGNVSLEKTTRNALALLEALRFSQDEICVYPGEPRPLEIEPLHAESIHGSYGIGGPDLPENPGLHASSESYLHVMHLAVSEYPGEICFVCTGALTNFARFIAAYPQDAAKIRLVSIMGGAFNCGNISASAEFNIRIDPHAAQVVFNDPNLKNKLLLAPLNLTHTALATPRVCSVIYDPKGKNCSKTREMFSQILTFYNGSYIKQHGHYGGPPVHDPLALFLVLPQIARETPELVDFADACDFHYLQRNLSVVTEGEEMGRTDYISGNMNPLRIEKGGVYVGQSVNIPFFWKHIFTALERADQQVASRAG